MKPTNLLIKLLCVVFLTRISNGARILGIFPLSAKSHFIMYRAVMRSLADAGHQVDVVSHFPLEKPHPNYTDIINLEGLLLEPSGNLTYQEVQNFNGLAFVTLLREGGKDACNLLKTPGMQKLIKNPPNNPPYDLFITEFLLTNCYLAFGRHLKVPVIGLTSLPISINADEALGGFPNSAVVLSIDDRPSSHMNFFQRIRNTIMTLFKSLMFTYCREAQNEIVTEIFGSHMPDVKQLETEVALNLVVSHPILTGVRPITPAIVEVAGIHIYDDHSTLPADLKKWLDQSEDGFLYFSFGSMLKIESFSHATLADIYKAFVKIAPLRVLLKVSNPEELPPGLPKNVLTMSWIPQVQVLKHKNIRAFITHGGLGGVQEALSFAVPMISIPLFGDQMANANACVQQGIAVSLDHRNLTTENIVAAVKAVVYDPKIKNRMNAVSKQFLDRPRNAKETAVFWIEFVLKYGAEALRSPAVYLSWWQLALLDVLGTILAAVLLLLYIVKLLVSALFSAIYSSIKKPKTLKKKKKNK